MIVQTAPALVDLSQRIFEAAGCPRDVAARVSAALVDANLAGHDSHGVIRIPGYVASVRDGNIVAAARPSIIRETAATTLVDGHWAFGQVSAEFATRAAVKKAKAEGISLAGIVRCNHIGRLGEYGELAAAEGVVAIILASGFLGRGVSAVPFGGAKPLFGTNPIAIGIPAGQEPGVLVDFATTAVAAGKIEVARAKRAPLPPGSIIDRDGNPTTDPEDYYNGGALLPFGGHKGYALSVMVEFLGRILTGADDFAEDGRGGVVYTHSGTTIIAIDSHVFSPADTYRRAADDTIHRIKAVPPAPGFESVLVPGEPERRSRAERLVSGIPLAEETWEKIQETSRQLGA